MSKVKISIIDPVGKKAGMDHYDLSLAEALNKRNSAVKVYSNFDKDDSDFIVNQFEFNFNRGLTAALKLITQFISSLRKSRADHAEFVILHLFHAGLINLLLIRLTKRFRFRICLIVHDVESFVYSNNKSTIKKCIRFSEVVIVHNQKSFDELEKCIDDADAGKIKIIPHGHFISLAEKIDRKTALEFLKLDQGKRYILFFGMIKKSKGLETLIEAMKNIPEDIHLIIAGRPRNVLWSDFERQIQQSGVSSRIHSFIHYISNEERHMFFNATDVVILPYTNIYQSGVMLLAMSYGLPVVATRLTGNEIVRDNENGLLFSSGEAGELASQVNSLVSDEEKRRRIGESAKRDVQSKHDWNKIGDALITALRG